MDVRGLLDAHIWSDPRLLEITKRNLGPFLLRHEVANPEEGFQLPRCCCLSDAMEGILKDVNMFVVHICAVCHAKHKRKPDSCPEPSTCSIIVDVIWLMRMLDLAYCVTCNRAAYGWGDNGPSIRYPLDPCPVCVIQALAG